MPAFELGVQMPRLLTDEQPAMEPALETFQRVLDELEGVPA